MKQGQNTKSRRVILKEKPHKKDLSRIAENVI